MSYKKQLKKEWVKFNTQLINQLKEKYPAYSPDTHTLYASIYKPLIYNEEHRCYVPNEDVKNPFYFTIRYDCSPVEVDFVRLYMCRGNEKDLLSYAKKIYEECEKEITENEAKTYLNNTQLLR